VKAPAPLTSQSPIGGGGAKSSSEGTITTSAPPDQPWPVAPMPLGAVASGIVRSSSTTVAVTSGGSAPDSSTVVAMADPSSTCAGSGSVHRDWGRGTEGTTRALWAKRFWGARD
jgi:hypothetical protein